MKWTGDNEVESIDLSGVLLAFRPLEGSVDHLCSASASSGLFLPDDDMLTACLPHEFKLVYVTGRSRKVIKKFQHCEMNIHERVLID